MVQDLINKHFFFLFLFTLTFGLILYDLIGFDYTDEICAGLLFVLFGYHLIKNPEWKMQKAFLFTICVFIFYLLYSFIIESNAKSAIIADLIIQLKPYMAFFCVYSIAPYFSKNQKVILRIITLSLWSFLFILGVINIFSPHIIRIVMGHVAYYAASVVGLSFCYLLTSNYTLKDKLIFILLLSAGIFSSRAKFYGFYALAVGIIFYFSNLKNLKFNLKNILIILGMLAIILVVAWNKIELYFLQGLMATEEDKTDLVARYALYVTSIEIFKDYFPFGSGFASFGTYYSGVYYSDIYVKYGIDTIWGINKPSYPYIADTYYPSLAQFGVAGLLLYMSFWLYIIKKAYRYFKTDRVRQLKYFTIILLLTGYFGIEGTSDSTFTAHRGFFILMVLGFTLSQMRYIYNEHIKANQCLHENTTD